VAIGLKIGILTSCFGLPARKGIETAAELGAEGIQLFTTSGELDPQALDASARDELRSLISSLDLELAALCGDFGGGGFTDASTVAWRIERTREVIDLAVDLGTRVVTTHIGVVPENEAAPEWGTMREALEEVGAYAEEKGRVLATETGPESPALLRQFLDSLRTRAVGVNYDPANLVMAGFDHLSGVEILADCIVHTHAKDGLRPPEGPREVPLGEGQVNFPEYLQRLQAGGYEGFLTVEREGGEDRVGDIRRAVEFLRRVKPA
jgi:L-ribulose-5-phosphate 3-epimerase